MKHNYPKNAHERERFLESLLTTINKAFSRERPEQDVYIKQNSRNVIQIMLERLPEAINLNTITIKPVNQSIVVSQGEITLREWNMYEQFVSCYFEETPLLKLSHDEYTTLTEGLKAPKEQSFWKRNVKINRS